MFKSQSLSHDESKSRYNQQNQQIWTTTLTKHTGYRESDVGQMAIDLLNFIGKIQKSQLKTMNKKYSDPKFQNVASILQSFFQMEDPFMMA